MKPRVGQIFKYTPTGNLWLILEVQESFAKRIVLDGVKGNYTEGYVDAALFSEINFQKEYNVFTVGSNLDAC